ncbi:hypothetical protein ACWDUD_08350 [Rhodococcus sp. NPDC003382]
MLRKSLLVVALTAAVGFVPTAAAAAAPAPTPVSSAVESLRHPVYASPGCAPGAGGTGSSSTAAFALSLLCEFVVRLGTGSADAPGASVAPTAQAAYRLTAGYGVTDPGSPSLLGVLATASSMPFTGSTNITAHPGLPNGGVGE